MPPKRLPQAIDPSQSKIPVFVSTTIPTEVSPSTRLYISLPPASLTYLQILSAFFTAANAATDRDCYTEPQGWLIQSLNDLNPAPEEGTAPPHQNAKPFVFEDWTPEAFFAWAEEFLDGTSLSPNGLVVLDERTKEDGGRVWWFVGMGMGVVKGMWR